MTLSVPISTLAGVLLAMLICQGCSLRGLPEAGVYADVPHSSYSAKDTTQIMSVAVPQALGLAPPRDISFETKRVSASLALDGHQYLTRPNAFDAGKDEWSQFVTREQDRLLSDVSFTGISTVGLLRDIRWSGDPTLNALSAAREARQIYEPYEQRTLDISATVDFEARSAQTGLAFDLGFSPRASLREEGDFSTRSIGAEVRLGQNFDQRGSHVSSGSWYIFAGADGEALIWETGERGIGLDLVNIDALKLRDRITVGDIQAGVSVERFGGQFSVSYIRREVEYKQGSLEIDQNENFAGLSFTLKR